MKGALPADTCLPMIYRICMRILKLAVHHLNEDQACESDSMVFDLNSLFQMPAVGLNEQKETYLKIYPNSATDHIYCELLDFNITGVYLRDIHSVRYPIKNFWLTEKGFRLDVSHLAPGVYIGNYRSKHIS